MVPASHRTATVVWEVEERDGGTASKAAGFRPDGGIEERGADTAALVAFSRTDRVVVTPTAAASDGEAGPLAKPGRPPPRRRRDDTGLGVRTTVRREDAIQVGGDGREVGSSPNRRGTNNVAIVADEVMRAVAVVFFFSFEEGDSEITRTAPLLDAKDRRMGGRMIGDGRGARRIEGGGWWKDSSDGDLRHVNVC